MSALGETFRTARESQGLTLSDVADRIHIRSVYLAAIEAEDWHAIGPAVYIRGFIRTYARTLGLDPDAAVAEFGSGTAPVILAPSPRGEPSRSGLPRGSGRKAGPSGWASLATIVALGLVVLAAYQFFEYRRATPAGRGPLVRASASPVEHPGRGSTAGHPAPGVRTAERKLPGSSGFTVRFRDSSWVRVVVDGRVAMEGSFPTGTTRSFAGRTITVRAGNAGGVHLSVDGKDLGPMGGLGDVAERSFQF